MNCKDFHRVFYFILVFVHLLIYFVFDIQCCKFVKNTWRVLERNSLSLWNYLSKYLLNQHEHPKYQFILVLNIKYIDVLWKKKFASKISCQFLRHLSSSICKFVYKTASLFYTWNMHYPTLRVKCWETLQFAFL